MSIGEIDLYSCLGRKPGTRSAKNRTALISLTFRQLYRKLGPGPLQPVDSALETVCAVLTPDPKIDRRTTVVSCGDNEPRSALRAAGFLVHGFALRARREQTGIRERTTPLRPRPDPSPNNSLETFNQGSKYHRNQLPQTPVHKSPRQPRPGGRTGAQPARRNLLEKPRHLEPKPAEQPGEHPPVESQSVGRDSEPDERSRTGGDRRAETSSDNPKPGTQTGRAPGEHPPMESQSVGRDSEPNEGSRARRDRRGESSSDSPKPGTQTGRAPGEHPPMESQSVGRDSEPNEGWRTGRNQRGESSSDSPKPGTQTGRTIRGTSPAEGQSVGRRSQPDEG